MCPTVECSAHKAMHYNILKPLLLQVHYALLLKDLDSYNYIMLEF